MTSLCRAAHAQARPRYMCSGTSLIGVRAFSCPEFHSRPRLHVVCKEKPPAHAGGWEHAHDPTPQFVDVQFRIQFPTDAAGSASLPSYALPAHAGDWEPVHEPPPQLVGGQLLCTGGLDVIRKEAWFFLHNDFRCSPVLGARRT